MAVGTISAVCRYTAARGKDVLDARRVSVFQEGLVHVPVLRVVNVCLAGLVTVLLGRLSSVPEDMP